MNKFNTFIVTLALAAVFTGCEKKAEHGHPHGEEQATPHEGEHSHGGGIAVTHYTDKTELFVEYPPLVAGESSAFAAHLTFLDPEGFKAVAEGKLVVTLSGGGLPEEQAQASVSDTPGIFRPVLKPQHAGKRNLSLRLDLPTESLVHDLGEVVVYSDRKAAEAALPPEEDAAISFTKEQQWKIPFATQVVRERSINETLPATATLRPGADQEAIIAAPGAGLLRSGPRGFPRVGDPVSAGQTIAFLAPSLGGGVDVATLRLEVDRARINAQQAAAERERLEGLLKLEAIPAKRVQEAVAREKLAQAELSSAQQRLATYGGASGGVALKSPISGQIIAVKTTPGGAVTEGQPVVHIANLKRLWLEARIAESDVHRVTKPTGATFTPGQDASPVILEVGKNAELVAFGGMVDPATRTVPAIFEFDNPDGQLVAGIRLNAHIHTGRLFQGVAVPHSAVVDESGTPVVYVLRDGEAFERRVITKGPRDGEWVAVQSGLQAGERVVTIGAYQVRLAATAPAEAGHGHAH